MTKLNRKDTKISVFIYKKVSEVVNKKMGSAGCGRLEGGMK